MAITFKVANLYGITAASKSLILLNGIAIHYQNRRIPKVYYHGAAINDDGKLVGSANVEAPL